MGIEVLFNGILDGGVYALIALGFTVIYKTVRFFHFAHGVVYAFGAYCVYTLTISLGFKPVLSSFLAATLAAALGAAIDRLVYLPLRKKGATPFVFLIASFGVFIFIQNLLQLLYKAQVLTVRTGPITEGYQILSAVITPIQLFIFASSIIICIFLALVMHNTKVGKSIIAVADSPIGASVAGIDPERVILSAFMIGSALAGIAGILVSLETNIEPTMGMNAILKGIIASIIGGIGSIPGALLGGFFLGLAENIGIWKIQAEWKDTISFAILILFLFFRPQGILGAKEDRI
jgi:branched-chain amino acid transport system permease protein